ncbi:TolB protein [Verrucomicrobium sp. GAS474]|uniref:PD40 domain-containing protein n=1 Tax=Verrucomicrobium sp. GAS474 TaxID=1882831 RepID=UPI00087C0057|nr:PD40 domain-containing protein [Verrucomicrobium sp. GAS474]SDT98346.1 TolB protein [Verrucomicrobium sp. GAS474]
MITPFRLLSVAAFTLCALALPLPAQVTVEGYKIPVSVAPFSGPGGEEAARIVIADLNRSLLIDATPGASGGKIVSATLSAGSLSGQLTDNGNSLVAKTFSGDVRRAAHLFSDEVLFALTRVKGFSTNQIAVISAQGGAKELCVVGIDGADGKKLTNDHTLSSRPQWSHDGTKIAYTSYLKGYPDCYVITLATSQRLRVAFFPGINTGASFSPDGGRLALTLSKDGSPQIYTIPSGGGAASRLTSGTGTATSPSWSPDGTRVVFDSDEHGSAQLYTVPAGGGTPTRLVTSVSYNTEPDWSPDGTKIAFTGRSAGQFQIGVYDLSTGRSVLVTTSGGQNPTWTTNSRHLVYARSGDLYILDTVTGRTAPLPVGLSRCSEPAIAH